MSGWSDLMSTVSTINSIGAQAHVAAANRNTFAIRKRMAYEASQNQLLSERKQQLFENNQALREAVGLASTGNRAAAIEKITATDFQMKVNSLVPEMFQDLGDKEYCQQTWALIAQMYRQYEHDNGREALERHWRDFYDHHINGYETQIERLTRLYHLLPQQRHGILLFLIFPFLTAVLLLISAVTVNALVTPYLQKTWLLVQQMPEMAQLMAFNALLLSLVVIPLIPSLMLMVSGKYKRRKNRQQIQMLTTQIWNFDRRLDRQDCAHELSRFRHWQGLYRKFNPLPPPLPPLSAGA